MYEDIYETERDGVPTAVRTTSVLRVGYGEDECTCVLLYGHQYAKLTNDRAPKRRLFRFHVHRTNVKSTIRRRDRVVLCVRVIDLHRLHRHVGDYTNVDPNKHVARWPISAPSARKTCYIFYGVIKRTTPSVLRGNFRVQSTIRHVNGDLARLTTHVYSHYLLRLLRPLPRDDRGHEHFLLPMLVPPFQTVSPISTVLIGNGRLITMRRTLRYQVHVVCFPTLERNVIGVPTGVHPTTNAHSPERVVMALMPVHNRVPLRPFRRDLNIMSHPNLHMPVRSSQQGFVLSNARGPRVQVPLYFPSKLLRRLCPYFIHRRGFSLRRRPIRMFVRHERMFLQTGVSPPNGPASQRRRTMLHPVLLLPMGQGTINVLLMRNIDRGKFHYRTIQGRHIPNLHHRGVVYNVEGALTHFFLTFQTVMYLHVSSNRHRLYEHRVGLIPSRFLSHGFRFYTTFTTRALHFKRFGRLFVGQSTFRRLSLPNSQLT